MSRLLQALLILGTGLCVGLVFLIRTQEAPPASSLISLPAAASARFPQVRDVSGEKILWWHRGGNLELSRLADSTWVKSQEVLTGIDSNWAEPASVILAAGRYHVVARRDGELLHFSKAEDTDWQLGDKIHPRMRRAEFPHLVAAGKRLLLFAIAATKTQSQLIMQEIGSSEAPLIVDPVVCECCRLSSVVNSDGSLLLAYRDRELDDNRPITVIKVDRNFEITRKPLTQPRWQISGCPVNGPDLARTTDGRTVLTWFTKQDGVPAVFANITGHNQEFTESLPLDQGEHVLGRVSAAPLGDHGAAVFWYSSRPGDRAAQLNGRLIEDGAERARSTVVVSGVDPSFDSGFPSSTGNAEGVSVFWTAAKRQMVIGRRFNRSFFLDRAGSAKPSSRPPDLAFSELLDKKYSDYNQPDKPDIDIISKEKPFTLLAFWASWCEPCIEEFPFFNSLAGRFPGLGFRTVILDQPQDLTGFLTEHQLTYPVLQDNDQQLATFYRVTSIPAAILFNRQKRLIWRHDGNNTRLLEDKINRSIGLP